MIRMLSRILFIIIIWIPIQVVAQVDDVNINSSNDIEPEDPYAYLHDNEVYCGFFKIMDVSK